MIFLTIFVSMIGFGIVIPVLPDYAKNEPFKLSATSLGWLTGIFSLAQFFMVSGGGDQQGFKARNRHGDGDEVALHRVEPAREVAVGARPGQLHGILRRPFGGQHGGH